MRKGTDRLGRILVGVCGGNVRTVGGKNYLSLSMSARNVCNIFRVSSAKVNVAERRVSELKATFCSLGRGKAKVNLLMYCRVISQVGKHVRIGDRGKGKAMFQVFVPLTVS